MAAIARIVEGSQARKVPGSSLAETDPLPPAFASPAAAPVAEPEDDPKAPGANGYSRLGPGPLPALRFRWTARREASGDYYVDETVGDYSRPITTGPMTAEEAVAYVDTQVKDARERFDRLKADISVKAPEASETPPDPDAGD
jgi:hypothetical protein